MDRMTDTSQRTPPEVPAAEGGPATAATAPGDPVTEGPARAEDRSRRPFARVLRVAIVVVCGLIGFVLVAQVRAAEDFDQRLAVEREEDLTRILSNLARQSDELARQITERRLLLYEFEVNSEREQLAVNSLQQRLDDLRVLGGTVEVVGNEGVRLTIDDPLGVVGQDRMVDVVQELRDAGAEAIAINRVRLVAQSAVTTRNDQLVLDGHLLESPYVIEAIGPARALSQGLAIAGGVESSLRARDGVDVNTETLAQVRLPARTTPVPFVYAEPVPEDMQTE